MLYNVMLGKLENNENLDGLTWSIGETERGNSYFRNVTNYQRINIGRYVSGKITNTYSDYIKTQKGDEIGLSYYEFPDKTKFVRYPNNYNMILLTTSKKDTKNYSEEHLMYINIVDTRYKLISYSVINQDDEIIQTYKVKDTLKGCCVKFSMLDNEGKVCEPRCIITLLVQDLTEKYNKYKRFEIYCNRSNTENAEIGFDIIDVTSQGDIKYIKKILKNKYPTVFKVSNKEGLITQGYVLTSDKYVSEIKEKLKDSGIDPVIVITNSKKLDTTSDQYDEAEVNRIKEIFKSKNIRVVTVYNANLPKSFSKEFNIKYMYFYDSKSNTSKCMKTN